MQVTNVPEVPMCIDLPDPPKLPRPTDWWIVSSILFTSAMVAVVCGALGVLLSPDLLKNTEFRPAVMFVEMVLTLVLLCCAIFGIRVWHNQRGEKAWEKYDVTAELMTMPAKILVASTWFPLLGAVEAENSSCRAIKLIFANGEKWQEVYIASSEIDWVKGSPAVRFPDCYFNNKGAAAAILNWGEAVVISHPGYQPEVGPIFEPNPQAVIKLNPSDFRPIPELREDAQLVFAALRVADITESVRMQCLEQIETAAQNSPELFGPITCQNIKIKMDAYRAAQDEVDQIITAQQ